MKKFSISTLSRHALLNITMDIQKMIGEMRMMDGVVTIFCPHTTAGITISNSADPDLRHDFLKRLDALVPADIDYKHKDGHADAHIKSALIGSSVQVIVENGLLQLGVWQAVYFCEFSGPQEREVWVR